MASQPIKSKLNWERLVGAFLGVRGCKPINRELRFFYCYESICIKFSNYLFRSFKILFSLWHIKLSFVNSFLVHPCVHSIFSYIQTFIVLG